MQGLVLQHRQQQGVHVSAEGVGVHIASPVVSPAGRAGQAEGVGREGGTALAPSLLSARSLTLVTLPLE
ncbi:hypothetical protein GCM10010140_45010 [Streptosporangium pseudovulgare]|uniref:Uncharacterized protein n=1 Tax=Streptosporangium pseudovulgare TaxID=35765 RepID=A0ABQ2R284_9ACTN|nr:hypothetical protein GCM10010140_45010 [Streptosporangium pseudovulgare]